MGKVTTDDELRAIWPKGMGMPAIRALNEGGMFTLEDVADRNESALASLHGMGPKGIRILKAALAEKGLGPLS